MRNMEDDLIRDVYQRLGGIEAKIDDIKAIRTTAENAVTIANRAEQLAKTNDRSITNINANLKWGFGLIAAAVVPIGIFILGQVLR